jgi:hypothetical protein
MNCFLFQRLRLLWVSGILLSVLTTNVCAQTPIIEETYFYSVVDDPVEKPIGENISNFEGWTFKNCTARSGIYLRVGSGSGPYTLGSVTTSELGIEGNVLLFVTTNKVDNISASFRISIDGEGSVNSTTYSVTGEKYRPSAILIKGCKPSTKVKIEGTSGKFSLYSIKALNIADAAFYESFNYMSSSGEFIFSSTTIKENQFDNYDGIALTNIRQAKGNIFINNSGSYTMPTIPVEESCKVLMTFKAAKFSDTSKPFTLFGTGDLMMAPFNSSNIDDLASSRNVTIEGTRRTWNDYSIILTNMSNTTELTLSGYDIFLDDIKITPIPSGLDQSKDNSTYIIANSGQVRNVTLTRTITPNIWCPLCLPFSVTQAMMDNVLGTCELRTLGSVNASTGIFTFNSIAADATIEAGTPFLVKTSSTVENPTFSGVTIIDTPAKSEGYDNYKFVGNYSPVYLQTNGTNLFLGTDGSLYQPGTEAGYNRLGGLRAYFVVPEEEASARVAILDEPAETTSVRMIKPSTNHHVFDLFGREQKANTFSPNLQIRDGRKILTK